MKSIYQMYQAPCSNNNRLNESLLNDYVVINEITDLSVRDIENNIVIIDNYKDTLTEIRYRYNIPDGTVIHYLKDNKTYFGYVLDDRKYAPSKRFYQPGYIHKTMIQLDSGIKDDLYYQVYEDECLQMEDSNCIILNPLI
jgi:hypothetical protein